MIAGGVHVTVGRIVAATVMRSVKAVVRTRVRGKVASPIKVAEPSHTSLTAARSSQPRSPHRRRDTAAKPFTPTRKENTHNSDQVLL